jgi:hypothetical protein
MERPEPGNRTELTRNVWATPRWRIRSRSGTMSDMPIETVPAPETLDSSPVLISLPLPRSNGEEPGHAIVVDHGVWASAPFETWLVRSGDGGRSWRATPGGAYGTLVEAQADLMSRTEQRANWAMASAA